ncbi:hypothetical protein DEH84_00410 [Aquabacterium olei]|uniref:DUF3304 domain-containing protein n=1 Tax=Aquabacterium olei TaxID=1296669 RepID=A0A2U8FM74_9BURK|nr:DUF3304 domain-containing protein [Aquabacterium olei]AWI52078.1 hypothetical protein DEH84_00410 [Aquabacterium olei]
MITSFTRTAWRLSALILLLGSTACSSAPKQLGLPVVGVNYTDFDYSMSVYDTVRADNRVSSGELTPFSAGGQMCCFDLPRQWQPGMKLKVRSYKGVSEGGKWVRDDVTEQLVEVPRYEPGELGTLWVLQFADGRVEVLNSMVSPEHPQWTGSVKGWPKPSLAYRTKIWKIYYESARDGVRLYEELLAELEQAPKERSNSAWAHAARYRPAELKGYTGPSDPAYLAHLRREYSEGLVKSKAQVKKLEGEEPR